MGGVGRKGSCEGWMEKSNVALSQLKMYFFKKNKMQAMYKKRENVYVVSQFQVELSFMTGKARRRGLIVR